MLSKTTTRKRDIAIAEFPYQGRTVSGSRIITDKTWPGVLFGKQITTSEGHAVSLLGDGDDIGGPFETTRKFYNHRFDITERKHGGFSIKPVPLKSSGNYCSFKQGVNPVRTGQGYITSANIVSRLGLVDSSPSSTAVLNGLGSQAINACKPTNPLADLGTALGEIGIERGITLPGISAWKERTLRAKSAGSEYLAAQFGWLPLISEMNATFQAFKQREKVLKQLLKDDGRNVRRSFSFPLEDNTEDMGSLTMTLGGPGHTISSYFCSPVGAPSTFQYERRTQRARWFSGAFTYTLGDENGSRLERAISAVQKYDKLYGVAPTPELIWNLAPWTWAIDWFVNVGDFVSFASDAALYGLVLRYGYLMETTIVTDRYTCAQPGTIVPIGPIEFSLSSMTKKRIRATPFGFGVTWDGFDPFQLSIIAALGITRWS